MSCRSVVEFTPTRIPERALHQHAIICETLRSSGGRSSPSVARPSGPATRSVPSSVWPPRRAVDSRNRLRPRGRYCAATLANRSLRRAGSRQDRPGIYGVNACMGYGRSMRRATSPAAKMWGCESGSLMGIDGDEAIVGQRESYRLSHSGGPLPIAATMISKSSVGPSLARTSTVVKLTALFDGGDVLPAAIRRPPYWRTFAP